MNVEQAREHAGRLTHVSQTAVYLTEALDALEQERAENEKLRAHLAIQRQRTRTAEAETEEGVAHANEADELRERNEKLTEALETLRESRTAPCDNPNCANPACVKARAALSTGEDQT